MHQRDFRTIHQNPHGWLAEHLIPILPIVYSNQEVRIYNISKVSYPLPFSDTVLVVPSDSRAKSWFFAYDFISHSGTNYTVMYDNDPSVLKAKNVILSYDPPQYYIMHDNFSLPSNANWDVVSGSWNYSPEGLHAGSTSNKTVESIILNPIAVPYTNLNMSTSFLVSKLKQNYTNYASIVYSWINPENYKYAGILLHKNSTYLYFVSVTDGVKSQFPTWPGLKVGLNVKPGDALNMTLSTQDGFEEFVLNGSETLRHDFNGEVPGSNKKAYVGLSYGKIGDMTFDYFNLQELRVPNLRNTSDYLKYVESEGVYSSQYKRLSGIF